MARDSQANVLTRPAHDCPQAALVEMQSGGIKPIKPTLFLVHNIGGEVISYSQMTHCLGPEQPVYGFQQAWPSTESEPPPSVEALAASYVEELLSVQPAEPLLLAGHSFGGIVAFEMAMQLIGEG